ncbi:MAG: NUDIX hydrolase [Gemmobacter sp.]
MKETPTTQFRPEDGEPRSQVGALCWRWHKRRVEVLLVTSRETARWVVPKGWPIEGLDGAGSAAREAWEEAGVRGEVQPVALGVYGYDKVMRRGGEDEAQVPCMVAVFALAVSRQLKGFPEAGQRRLRWFSQAKAAKKVDEAELKALIAGFAAPGKARG